MVDVTTEQSMDMGYEDDDEDDDEDLLSPRDRETFMRAAAAFQVSADVLNGDRDATHFGPASFGLIALGLMLDIAKKAAKLIY